MTGEFYTKREHFPGFGRPFVVNSEVLLKSVYFFHALLLSAHYSFCVRDLHSYRRVGRNLEAKDSARVALKSPWWTLGCNYHVSISYTCILIFDYSIFYMAYTADMF